MSYTVDSEASRIRRALETFIAAQNGGDKRETKNKLWFLCLAMSCATWLHRLAFKALPRAYNDIRPHVIEIKNDEYRDGVFTFVYYSLELDDGVGRLVEWARTKSQPSSTKTVLWEEANPLAAVFRTVDMFRDEPIDRNAETCKRVVPPLDREAIAETTRVLLAAAQERTLLDGELSHYAHMIDRAANQSGFDGWCTASTHGCWLSEHGIAFELKIVEEEERQWDDDVYVTYELDVGYPSVFREKFTEPFLHEDDWGDEVVTELWSEPDPVDAVLRFIEQFRWDPQPVAEPVPPLEFATLALVDAHENRGLLDPSTATDRLTEAMAAAWARGPDEFIPAELGDLADAMADSLGIDPDRFGLRSGACGDESSAQLDIWPFVWRNGDRIVVRYALDMTADEATITETIGGLPVNTLFTGTPLVAVSEFVTLLDDVL